MPSYLVHAAGPQRTCYKTALGGKVKQDTTRNKDTLASDASDNCDLSRAEHDVPPSEAQDTINKFARGATVQPADTKIHCDGCRLRTK